MSGVTRLSTLTTLKVGGPVARVYECNNLADLEEALASTRREGLSWFPLGGGSNVLASDDGFNGSVLLMRMPALHFNEESNGTVTCIAEAGVDWNVLVDEVAARGLWGIENLAGIPGSAGASPIQNIGAYGAELSDALSFVEVYDASRNKSYRLSAGECDLAYRDSRFKREPNLLVVAVGLMLRKFGSANIAYKDIANRVSEGADISTPAAVASLVREIRSYKFPDLNEHGTAGSFFKNPVVTETQFRELQKRYPELPGYAHGDKVNPVRSPQPVSSKSEVRSASNGVKVSLAWILDNVLSLRGFTLGAVALFKRQPLVLVTHDGATAHDIEVLATEVARRVHDATGITIEREVRSIEPRT